MHFKLCNIIFLNMLKEYLDNHIYNLIIKNFNFNDITEIRMRVNQKLIIVIKNKKYYLKDENQQFVIISKFTIMNFIKKASENSIYAYNDSIINGYLTLPKGIRIGISGYVVSDNNKTVTIKDFQSVNIRIPHFIKNCSLPAYDFIVNDEVKNTLIISSPGSGKTTFLRDLIYQMSEHNCPKNILVADERNEICSVINSEPALDLGGFCDIYTNCSKEFAFKNGIRSMCPDVIITDEIDLDKDANCILDAINCGVSVIATIHAKDINQLKMKRSFEKILNEKYFSRFIVLTNHEGPGTLSYIYDERLNLIYCR